MLWIMTASTVVCMAMVVVFFGGKFVGGRAGLRGGLNIRTFLMCLSKMLVVVSPMLVCIFLK